MEYLLPIPGEYWIFVGIVYAVLIVTGVLSYVLVKDPKRWIAPLVILIVTIGSSYLLVIAPLQIKMKVTKELITLEIPPYATKQIKPSDVQSIYIADLASDELIRPKIRTSGTGFGKYKTGWFKLADGRDALLMISEERVLILQTDGLLLMVSPGGIDKLSEDLVKTGWIDTNR